VSAPLPLELAGAVVVGAAWRSVLPLALGGLCARPGLGASGQHAVWALAVATLPVLAVQAALQPGPLVPHGPLLFGLWLTGALAAAAVPLVGVVQLARQTRASSSFGTTAGGTPVRLADVAAPLTWRALRPVVLLPRAAVDWTPAERALVLAHEQAHVDRRDWLVHVLAWAVCAIFWFQPLAWWARGRLSARAEDAVDDAVLRGGVRPSAYARLLLGVGGGAPGLGLSVAASPVARRVRRVLAPTVGKDRRAGVLRLGGLVVAGVVLGAAALAPPPPAPGCQVDAGPSVLLTSVEVLP
jgi:beta-lactamase regulating signal transducer with metallopeptidase domain